MKRVVLFILILIYPTFSFANADDCKTDVYFANGIKTKEEDARYYAMDILEPAIEKMLGTEAFSKQIGEVAYSYNHTIGFFSDGIETFLQKFGWMDWRDLLGDIHGEDVDRHVKAYQASINAEHKVLVVAHSQGNLFTYEAYTALSSDMQKSFEAGTPRIDFDNDPVPRISTFGAELPNMIPNDVRVTSRKSNFNTKLRQTNIKSP